jgi:hypothetical protein
LDSYAELINDKYEISGKFKWVFYW